MKHQEVMDIVAHFYSVISKPIEKCCTFYVLYYLNKVEDALELRTRFNNISDDLSLAFWNYGIYCIGRELRHALALVSLISNRYDDLLKLWASYSDIEREVPLPEADKVRLSKRIGKQNFNFIEDIRDMLRARKVVSVGKGYFEVEEYCIGLEEHLKAFSSPLTFLERSMSLFDIESATSALRWMTGYGGNMYVKICKTLLNRRAVSPTLFVDMCWAIEHNTGKWIDKVNQAQSEISYIEDIWRKKAEPSFSHLKDTLFEHIFFDLAYAMKNILDANETGNLLPLFEIAVYHQPWLEKYRGKIKPVEPTPLEPTKCPECGSLDIVKTSIGDIYCRMCGAFII